MYCSKILFTFFKNAIESEITFRNNNKIVSLTTDFYPDNDKIKVLIINLENIQNINFLDTLTWFYIAKNTKVLFKYVNEYYDVNHLKNLNDFNIDKKISIERRLLLKYKK